MCIRVCCVHIIHLCCPCSSLFKSDRRFELTSSQAFSISSCYLVASQSLCASLYISFDAWYCLILLTQSWTDVVHRGVVNIWPMALSCEAMHLRAVEPCCWAFVSTWKTDEVERIWDLLVHCDPLVWLRSSVGRHHATQSHAMPCYLRRNETRVWLARLWTIVRSTTLPVPTDPGHISFID